MLADFFSNNTFTFIYPFFGTNIGPVVTGPAGLASTPPVSPLSKLFADICGELVIDWFCSYYIIRWGFIDSEFHTCTALRTTLLWLIFVVASLLYCVAVTTPPPPPFATYLYFQKGRGIILFVGHKSVCPSALPVTRLQCELTLLSFTEDNHSKRVRVELVKEDIQKLKYVLVNEGQMAPRRWSVKNIIYYFRHSDLSALMVCIQ